MVFCKTNECDADQGFYGLTDDIVRAHWLQFSSAAPDCGSINLLQTIFQENREQPVMMYQLITQEAA